MDKTQKIVLGVGILIMVGLVFIDILYAFIALIILGVLAMSFYIMGESLTFPNVSVRISDDARSITVVNEGSAGARNIHVVLVPLNIEFDIASLEPDEESGVGLESMVAEVKAVVKYEDAVGQQYMRTYKLTSMGDDWDPLRPVIPVFKQK
jgi:hypothetical protein